MTLKESDRIINIVSNLQHRLKEGVILSFYYSPEDYYSLDKYSETEVIHYLKEFIYTYGHHGAFVEVHYTDNSIENVFVIAKDIKDENSLINTIHPNFIINQAESN